LDSNNTSSSLSPTLSSRTRPYSQFAMMAQNGPVKPEKKPGKSVEPASVEFEN